MSKASLSLWRLLQKWGGSLKILFEYLGGFRFSFSDERGASVSTDDREFLNATGPADQLIYDRVLPAKSRLLDVREDIDWDAYVPILRS